MKNLVFCGVVEFWKSSFDSATDRACVALRCCIYRRRWHWEIKAALWRYGSGVRGGGMHAQRDAAGVGAERKTLGLDEQRFMTLEHDSALIDNDEAGVVGPGVACKCDLLVREYADHVARLVDVEPHTLVLRFFFLLGDLRESPAIANANPPPERIASELSGIPVSTGGDAVTNSPG